MAKDTRQSIVSGAFRAMVDNGYEHTSIKDIAAAAGVAPGLVHYYFASKEDLLVEVLQDSCERFQLAEGASAEEVVAVGFETFKRALVDEGEFHRLLLDMSGLALHNPRVAAALLGFVRADRGRVEEIAAWVLGAQAGRDPAAAAPIAAAVWAAVYGIIFQNLIDPAFDAAGAVEALAAMVASIAAPVTAGSSPA